MARKQPVLMNTLPIHRNDRVAYVGATGSGKTTLAKALMWGLRHVVIIDPKRTFKLPDDFLPGFPPVTIDGDKTAVLEWLGPGPLIYRPSIDEANDPDLLDWLYDWILRRQNTLLFVDELAQVSNNSAPTKGYSTLVRLGREVGVGVWSATQRPASVPVIMFSESEHIFIFRLRFPEDRKRVRAYTVPEAEEPLPTGPGLKNSFYYYSDDAGLVYYKSADIGKLLERR